MPEVRANSQKKKKKKIYWAANNLKDCYSIHSWKINFTWNITAKNIHRRWKLQYNCKKVRCSTNVLVQVCQIGFNFARIVKYKSEWRCKRTVNLPVSNHLYMIFTFSQKSSKAKSYMVPPDTSNAYLNHLKIKLIIWCSRKE